MRTRRLQHGFELAATMLFALGFVLAGSGWSFVLSTIDSDRPSWSVCGQAMCSCVMPTPEDPACPLCVSGLMDPDERSSDAPVRRVPKNNDSIEALGGAGTNVAIAFFVGTMMGHTNSMSFVDTGCSLNAAENDRVPWSRGLELPTPPPRA
ncbi:MAG: hypothetical protein ACSHX5_09550 [Phycisphaerales bacterium]